MVVVNLVFTINSLMVCAVSTVNKMIKKKLIAIKNAMSKIKKKKKIHVRPIIFFGKFELKNNNSSFFFALF